MAPTLPSVNALRAFEAVSRHHSMTLAAKELFVTHGAISRHIKSLEETLGVSLLTRNAQSTDPTPEGIQLSEGLTAAFNLMHASIERIKPGPLTLSCSSSIMMGWIIPRISGFHQRHPNIEIQFNMNYDRIDFVRDKISMAIRSDKITPPGDAVICDFGDEPIGPVCSPEYLRSQEVATPDDLQRAFLLATHTRPESWNDWCEAFGRPALELKSQQNFDHFYLAIQAAACGLGVAVVPRMLILDDLESGKLVAPFGFVTGPRRLVLWIAPHLAKRADLKALQAWLTQEMQQSAGGAT